MLIVEPDEKLARELGEVAKKAIEGCQLIFCKEGYKAAVRMENAAPNVVVTGYDLHKSYTGRKLVETILKNRRFDAVSVIVVGGVGFEGLGTEQIGTGQLQFVPNPLQGESFENALSRASVRGRVTDGEYQVRLLQPGQPLFKEGEAAEHAYLLKKGKLRAFLVRDGRTETLGEILPGEFVGEMAYIDGEPRSANVDAVDYSEVIEIPLKNLDAIVLSKPAWSKALLKTLSRRLKGANQKKVA